MSIHLALHEDGDHSRYDAYRNGACIATLRGQRHVLDTLVAILNWEGAVEEPEVKAALAQYIFEDCKAHGRGVLIHLTEGRRPIWEALCAAGFELDYENRVFRHNLVELPVPSRVIDLRPMREMHLAPYQQLFFDCNLGDPLKKGIVQETPAAFLDRFIAEIGALHIPELVEVAYWEGHVIGIVNFRVTTSHGKTARFMNYIGIHPDFRGRGLGVDLHRHGLRRLKEFGAEVYIGSTHQDNHIMQAVFARNDATLWSTQVYLRAR